VRVRVLAQQCDMKEEMRAEVVDAAVGAMEKYSNNMEVRAPRTCITSCGPVCAAPTDLTRAWPGLSAARVQAMQGGLG
jgi:hypothetical protein